MSYKIVVDSCCELPDYCHKDDRYEIVPLTLEVEEEQIIDDESFDQASFLQNVAASPKCPRSSCHRRNTGADPVQGKTGRCR